GDVVRVVEGGCAAVERGIVELPLRRGELPDQPVEVAPVLLVAELAALGGEIKLVPPLEFGVRGERNLARFLAADEISADSDQGLTALRPQCSEDAGGPRSPIETGENRLFDPESVKKVLEIDCERGGLTVAEGLA